MPDQLAPTNVFRFLAIRPPQLVTDQDTQLSHIRDTRRDAAFRVRSAQDNRSADLAGGLWQEGRQSLRPLSEVFLTLRRVLDGATRTPFDLDSVFEKARNQHAGFLDLDAANQQEGTAWDLLYAAYFSAPEPGLYIDSATSALRVVHFLRAAKAGRLANWGDADIALSAIPLIAPAGQPTAHRLLARQSVETTTNDDDSALLQAGYKDLVMEANTTRDVSRMLNALLTQKATVTQTSKHCDSMGQEQQRSAVISNVPTVNDAMRGSREEAQYKLLTKLGLADTTPLPHAIVEVNKHLSSLYGRAYALRDEPGFLSEVGATGGDGLITVIPVSQRLVSVRSQKKPKLISVGRARIRSVPDVNVRGRIRPLGIGELKVVRETLLAYVPGEVSHIENVLKGEFKEHKIRVLDRAETLLATTEEETRSAERDLQTTDRSELKNEVEKTVKEDLSLQAGLTVTANYGTVSVTAQGDFAYSTSKQDSAKNSATLAHEVIERSINKVETRVKTERSTKTTHETETNDTHGFDNKTNPTGNVTGVYRWVDKKYRAQVYRYDVPRLMLEFIVPDPAAFYRYGTDVGQETSLMNLEPPPAFAKADGAPLSANDIDESNYTTFAARYGATGVKPPPAQFQYIGKAFTGTADAGKSIAVSDVGLTVPTGYSWRYWRANTSITWLNYPRMVLQVAGAQFVIIDQNHPGPVALSTNAQDSTAGNTQMPQSVVPLSVVGYDICGFAVNIEVVCERDPVALQQWKLTTFDTLYTAYKTLETAYQEKLQRLTEQRYSAVVGNNPDTNRAIEKRELKKSCITLVSGSHFYGEGAVKYPSSKPSRDLPEIDVYQALDVGPVIQFFEQAFEWDQMTYLFYPYFWAGKELWLKITATNDPDPLFERFLQAGAARVVVPVRPAYTDAMKFYLQTGGIFNGGGAPTLEDPLYVGIDVELRHATGGSEEKPVPDSPPWSYSIPTSLVWLQGDSTLPVFDTQ